MSTPEAPNLDAPQVGRPQLSAVRDPLARKLADLLFAVSADLAVASRLVERRQVDDYLAQGETIGAALFRLVILHGQLASLDEVQGGKMHGTVRPEFPPTDPAIAERVAAFAANRQLEATQRRPWPVPETDDGADDAG